MSAMSPARPAPEPLPAQHVMQLATGYWVSRCVHIVAQLNIADLLACGPKSVEELASATGTDPGALYRVLRALASTGLFAEIAPSSFALTPMGETLRSDVPGSIRPMVLFTASDMHWAVYKELMYSVKTGKRSFDYVYRKAPFEWIAENPDTAQLFDQAMSAHTAQEEAAILAAYDFSPFGSIVDIAGGNGRLLGAILDRYPQARGMLFDLPHVIERARTAGFLTERAAFVPGSFFEAVPAGAQAYILKHIIHDWDDAEAVQILANCRRAMRPGARVLLMEMVIPPGNDPFYGKVLDIEMLVIPGGRERTAEEYGALFARAGLQVERIVPTPSAVSVIEASAV